MYNYRFHNNDLSKLCKKEYSIDELNHIYNLLKGKGTFDFTSLDNGLFPAASLKDENKFTNYDKVWVRDNIYLANAYYEYSEKQKAQRNIYSLSNFFYKYRSKFIDIIEGKVSAGDPMNRPHIRFDGTHLVELPEKWAHAENDALGYYLWLMLKMANNNDLVLRSEEKELIPIFASYFNKIAYWEDEDSGHWEETRKIETSSIGVVVGALIELKKFLTNKDASVDIKKAVAASFADKLIEKGISKLTEILPNECNQNDVNKFRDVDAAQLFLIYPICLFENYKFDADYEDQILKNVQTKLLGEYGIKRYIGDSFWTANTKRKQDESEITADYSDRIEERNKNHRIGEEAQWCIFDSIISIIYGKRFIRNRHIDDYEKQVHYFNRSLAQVTGADCKYGAYQCPELYYLENGQYTNNDTVPLLWAQSNLWLAFKELKHSIALMPQTLGD